MESKSHFTSRLGNWADMTGVPPRPHTSSKAASGFPGSARPDFTLTASPIARPRGHRAAPGTPLSPENVQGSSFSVRSLGGGSASLRSPVRGHSAHSLSPETGAGSLASGWDGERSLERASVTLSQRSALLPVEPLDFADVSRRTDRCPAQCVPYTLAPVCICVCMYVCASQQGPRLGSRLTTSLPGAIASSTRLPCVCFCSCRSAWGRCECARAAWWCVHAEASVWSRECVCVCVYVTCSLRIGSVWARGPM